MMFEGGLVAVVVVSCCPLGGALGGIALDENSVPR